MERIRFFSEGIIFSLPSPIITSRWIKSVIRSENHKMGDLNFIFCSDKHLKTINERFLKHDSLTDIITFDNSEEPGILTGDIYISIDRVSENSKKYKVSFNDELHRVMIHGVLHLAGYRDKSKEDKMRMRKIEHACLSLRPKALM